MELIQNRIEEEQKERRFKIGITNHHLIIIGIIFILIKNRYLYIHKENIELLFPKIGLILGSIYVFFVVNSFINVENKYIEIIKFYIGFIFFNIISGYIDINILNRESIFFNSNIFNFLFIINYCLIFFEFIINGIKEKEYKKSILGLLGYLILISFNFTYFYIKSNEILSQIECNLIELFLPTFNIDRNYFIFIILGDIFYILLKSKFWVKSNKVNKKDETGLI